MPWKLTVRAAGRVERERFAELGRALDVLEARCRELAAAAPRRTIDIKLQRFAPARQVAARVELAGPERLLPSVKAGIDVRGDGSTEAYLGRVSRDVLEQGRGETSYAALRRALSNSGSSSKKG